jgi:hypothetical protein
MTDQAKKNADLIDRYIAAVEHRLPPKDAKDIVAELRQAIGDKIEAKEAETGRTATKDEVIAIIKSFGSPMLAAGRYNSRSQHLIGPEVYPYYWPAVRIVVGIVAAVAIVGFLVQGVISDDPMRHVLRGLGAAWNGALMAVAAVTISFIVMDHAKAWRKLEEAWRPDHLPRFSRFDRPKTLFESLFALAWHAVFIAWWVGVLRFPNMVPGTPEEQGVTIDFNSPAWAPLFAPVLVMAAAQAAIHVADVIHPAWSRVRSVASMAIAVIGLWSVWLLAQGEAQHGQLFLVDGPPGAAAKVAELNEAFATVSQVTIIGLAIGFGIALVVEAWRLLRSLQAGAAASPAAAGNGG